MARKKREHTDVTKRFADVLSDLIEEKKRRTGKNHKEIALEIGVSDGALSEWASDNKTANIDGLVAVAKYFGVTSDYLLGLSEVKSRNLTTQSISKATGLSEEAIETLRTFSKREDIESPMIFINSLLEDPKTIYIITLMVNELLYSNDDELTDAERLRMEGGRLWECQKALSELIEKIRREKHGTDN